MTTEELIAALEAAPEGTRELGVAVLEAVGAKYAEHADANYWYIVGEDICDAGDEARVVTDLNFRLPGVPEGWWNISGPEDDGIWVVTFMSGVSPFTWEQSLEVTAHTEALARIIVQLKAVLAMKGEKQ